MKIAKLGVIVALSMILGYVESMLPLPIPIPGIKLGLANLVTIVSFYLIGLRESWLIAMVRICLLSILFGSFYSWIFSMAGGICSLLFMSLALKCKIFSMTAVSCVGGVAHNVGQIVAAAILMNAGLILMYIPLLIIGGVVSGIIIGLIGSLIIGRIKKAGVKGYEYEG